MAQGTIHGIQIALGIGVIRPHDGADDLPFDRGALEAGAFEELREGQWVSYEAVPDPHDPARRRAHTLRLLEE
jgi:cold shock CspA family protein